MWQSGVVMISGTEKTAGNTIHVGREDDGRTREDRLRDNQPHSAAAIALEVEINGSGWQWIG